MASPGTLASCAQSARGALVREPRGAGAGFGRFAFSAPLGRPHKKKTAGASNAHPGSRCTAPPRLPFLTPPRGLFVSPRSSRRRPSTSHSMMSSSGPVQPTEHTIVGRGCTTAILKSSESPPMETISLHQGFWGFSRLLYSFQDLRLYYLGQQ